MKRNNQNQKGFTLIEMLVSIFIIAFSLVGIFNLNSKYNQQTLQEKESFIATLLAQEGIEIIKNMRDTNSLNDQCWMNGITEGVTCTTLPVPSTSFNPSVTTCLESSQGCEVDYNNLGGSGVTGLTGWGSAFTESSDPSDGHYLYLKGGFYGYDTTSGAVWTPYRRRIVITYPYLDGTIPDNATIIHKGVHVRSIVYWKGKKVEVRQEIFDWKSL